MSIENLATFFGWCAVIHFGLLFFAGLSWILVKGGVSEFTAVMFGVTKEEVRAAYFRGFLQYKAAVFVLGVVPYIALKTMA